MRFPNIERFKVWAATATAATFDSELLLYLHLYFSGLVLTFSPSAVPHVHFQPRQS